MLIQCVNSVACFPTSYGLILHIIRVETCVLQRDVYCVYELCRHLQASAMTCQPCMLTDFSELFIAQRCIDRFGGKVSTHVCLNVR